MLDELAHTVWHFLGEMLQLEADTGLFIAKVVLGFYHVRNGAEERDVLWLRRDYKLYAVNQA